jgi:hypothetical protein
LEDEVKIKIKVAIRDSSHASSSVCRQTTMRIDIQFKGDSKESCLRVIIQDKN